MAIYHMSAQAISRSGGGSAVAAAAYRAAEKIEDRRTGEEHDYSRRRGVDHAEIVAPANAPQWARDRAELWNAAEAAERRKDSQVAREVRVAIPAELGESDRRRLVREYAKEQFARRGMVADIAIHGSEGKNPHAHILLTMRRLEGNSFARTKERGWNSKKTLARWRSSWARKCNRALERAGSPERIDHRTLAEQRADALRRGDAESARELDREPEVHLGAAYHMEQDGIKTDRGDELLKRQDRNRERRRLPGQQALLARIQRQLDTLRRLRKRLRKATKELYAAARKKGLPAPEPERRQAPRKAPARRRAPTPGWSR